MSTVHDTDLAASTMELAHSMRWFIKEEEYLHRLHEACLQLSHDYMRLHKGTHRTQTRFRLPAIILSSCAGFASFGSSGFGSDEASRYISIAVGVVNIGIAIMQTYESYLKINDIVSQSLTAATALKKLADDIHCETFLPVEDRNDSGITFLRAAFTRFQAIMEAAPTLDEDSEYKGIGFADLQARFAKDIRQHEREQHHARRSAFDFTAVAHNAANAVTAMTAPTTTTVPTPLLSTGLLTTAGGMANAAASSAASRALSRFNSKRYDQAICVRPARSQTSSGQLMRSDGQSDRDRDRDREREKTVSFKLKEFKSSSALRSGTESPSVFMSARHAASMPVSAVAVASALRAQGVHDDGEAYVALDMSPRETTSTGPIHAAGKAAEPGPIEDEDALEFVEAHEGDLETDIELGSFTR